MPRWEYSKINLSDTPPKTDEMELLNAAGNDGWELVGITTNNFAYLKRRIEEVAPVQEDLPPAGATRRKAATGAK